ncbi:hypothetical protein ISN45_Aa04g034190 [Arabidopsis thaliana x Arabidopsis arenosa]|uniref:Uncharacterized protein n=1 Tax=Arabidopsis thaliana x Arabidopsis arenosa TaxID=1240361 RepID=A0A8T2ABQ4_9BRAS|nr:hypothetical protein ISN45_Aa04g034190 [Arabidopsis thaliana x Arabidopsis arenosa]
MEVAVEDESNSKADETEKAIASFSEAAAKIDPSDLAAFLEQLLDKFWCLPEDQVGIPEEADISFFLALLILKQFPLSHISTSVYDTSVDWINKLPFLTLRAFVLWACKSLADAKPTYQPVALLIGLAMILRSKPAALTAVLPKLRDRPIYQGLDKLPLLVWMMAQASQGDLSAGLYSWAHNLLPLVEARTILVNRAVRDGERLIPPSSFEILIRLTFPPSSARVKATKRFEKVYPLLKEVALAPETATQGNAVEQIFTFSLKLAGEGNPGLAKEAAAIAMWSVTENVDCFKHWEILYKEHLEASVALLVVLGTAVAAAGGVAGAALALCSH